MATAANGSHPQAAMRDEEMQTSDDAVIQSDPSTMTNGKIANSGPPSPTEREVAPASRVSAEEQAVEDLVDEEETETTKFVEWDPTGRFGRTTELLGRGTYKNVYKAFDEEEGMDVAWNQVKVHGLPAAEKQRLLGEVEILKRLDHKNVLKFYHSWNTVNEKTGEVSVNFITEACAGTLNKYAARFKNNLDMRAVKSWARQILRGLEYLHSHEPPIVHRDLKCDNIFVNGNAGEIKIGDLGLAAMLDHQRTHSVIGTPEFMAPELYEEDYDERVDIYSFGMCLMELVTFECPYNECKNPAQIYKRVSSGVLPAAMEKVKEKGDDIYEFISLAIAPADERPSAAQLLEHAWLKKKEKKTMVPRQVVEEEPEVPRPIVHEVDEEEPTVHASVDDLRRVPRVPSESETEFAREHKRGASLDVRVKGTFLEDDSLRLRLRIADDAGQNRTVGFPFNTGIDNSRSVAAEMVQELGLDNSAIDTIEREIEKEVKYLWEQRRGYCERDTSHDPIRWDSVDGSGASSPEEKTARQEVIRAVAAEGMKPSASNESLSERVLVDDHALPSQISPIATMIAREELARALVRPKSALDAFISKRDAPAARLSRAGSGDVSPTRPSPMQSPSQPTPAPSAAEMSRTLEQLEAAKPPRAPVSNAQPMHSEILATELRHLALQDEMSESAHYGDKSSDAGSFVNEEEMEEMEELRMLEELEQQQQIEEAEMRQRHKSERQQTLRSLHTKRLERTASRMALLNNSENGSESGRAEEQTGREVPVAPPAAPTLAQTHPTTRLSQTNLQISSHTGLPPQHPHPPPQAAAQPVHLPPAQQSSQQHHAAQVQQPVNATTNAVEQVQAAAVPTPPAQVAQLQSEAGTLSRTTSQGSMPSEPSDPKMTGESELTEEERCKLEKEKKRKEALAKMQMMEESSLLSLDSKTKGAKGSAMSLSAALKKDSSDELQLQAEVQ